MKHVASILLLLVVGLSACTKTITADAVKPIDPREKLTGIYDVGFQARTTVATLEGAPESGTAILTVSKSAQPNELILDFLYNGSTKEQLVALLTGNKYTVTNKKTETIYALNKTFQGEYSGNGEFTDKNEFILVTVAQTQANGTLVKRVGSNTGTKR